MFLKATPVSVYLTILNENMQGCLHVAIWQIPYLRMVRGSWCLCDGPTVSGPSQHFLVSWPCSPSILHNLPPYLTVHSLLLLTKELTKKDIIFASRNSKEAQEVSSHHDAQSHGQSFVSEEMQSGKSSV